MKKKHKILLGAAIAAILATMAFVVLPLGSKAPNFSFDTARVSKTDVRNIVTATGTLQAIKTVEVGTQVSGVVKNLLVDFNSVVKKGQLLAEIDKAPLLTTLANSQAQLDNAKAELTYQKANYERTKALYDKQLVAQYDYDQAVYNLSKAKASLSMAETEYSRSKINLDYASIYSPIDGVVLNRAVDEGQTVAASFNTPTLFTIANDLTQMQVEANIDEADIGQVRKSQSVSFQVDAFPEMTFDGTVSEIRLQPTSTSNVVTYTVIVNAPNPTLKLMPGMTANITIVVEQALGAEAIPVKALRFTPEAEMYEAYLAEQHARFSDSTPQAPEHESLVRKPNENRVWVKEGPHIYSKKVELGISDGIHTEIKSGLANGEEVIVSMSSDATAAGAQRSPFMPRRPGSDRKDKK